MFTVGQKVIVTRESYFFGTAEQKLTMMQSQIRIGHPYHVLKVQGDKVWLKEFPDKEFVTQQFVEFHVKHLRLKPAKERVG